MVIRGRKSKGGGIFLPLWVPWNMVNLGRRLLQGLGLVVAAVLDLVLGTALVRHLVPVPVRVLLVLGFTSSLQRHRLLRRLEEEEVGAEMEGEAAVDLVAPAPSDQALEQDRNEARRELGKVISYLEDNYEVEPTQVRCAGRSFSGAMLS